MPKYQFAIIILFAMGVSVLGLEDLSRRHIKRGDIDTVKQAALYRQIRGEYSLYSNTGRKAQLRQQSAQAAEAPVITTNPAKSKELDTLLKTVLP